jgi:sortase A
MLLEQEPRTPPRRRGERVRGSLRALSSILIVSGVLLMIDAGITLVWQEPVSAVYAKLQQRQLEGDLDSAQALSELQLRALERLRTEGRRMSFLARVLRRDSSPGDPIGTIRIRRLGISFVVVEGTKSADLRKGPGHYEDTPFPGNRGTVAIAGHRVTYLAPFRKLNEVRRGDLIEVEMPYGTFTYRAEFQRIVDPDAYEYVTSRRRYDRVALTACHPLYSAAQRIVVFGRFVRAEARGRARVRAEL